MLSFLKDKSGNNPAEDKLAPQLETMQQMLDDLQQNVQMLVRNQADANDVAAMRKENEAYRSDNNIKLMRAYGIDALIKLYQSICDKLFVINHPIEGADLAKNEIEKNVYLWTLKNLERQFKHLGIRLQHSEVGVPVNEEYMELYGSQGEDVDDTLTLVSTDDVQLQDTVKESVCPAFIWTIPTLNGSQKEWVMAPEKICMYK